MTGRSYMKTVLAAIFLMTMAVLGSEEDEKAKYEMNRLIDNEMENFMDILMNPQPYRMDQLMLEYKKDESVMEELKWEIFMDRMKNPQYYEMMDRMMRLINGEETAKEEPQSKYEILRFANERAKRDLTRWEKHVEDGTVDYRHAYKMVDVYKKIVIRTAQDLTQYEEEQKRMSDMENEEPQLKLQRLEEAVAKAQSDVQKWKKHFEAINMDGSDYILDKEKILKLAQEELGEERYKHIDY